MSLINHSTKMSHVSERSFVTLDVPKPQAFTSDVQANSKLEQISLYALLAIVKQLGIDKEGIPFNTFEELPLRLNILPKYNLLFLEILEELILQEYVSIENRTVRISESNSYPEISLENALDQLTHFGQEYSDFKAHAQLLSSCLNRFSEILLGKIKATDIIFPLGSLGLVEGIYKGNKQADYFNQLLAIEVSKSVANAVKQLVQGEKIKILEIGAGTGGTTKDVLDALQPFKNEIEYTFTDLSKSFLINAQTKFGNVIPHFKTQLLNIESDPIEQNIAKGSYDIVIAANVMHATKDITVSLENLKKILKAQGITFMNEIARKELFTTLTFGLLDGWWLFEDQELRLKNNPGISAEIWEIVLEEVGFDQNYFYPANNTCSQHIIAARSNGVIEEITTKNRNVDQAPSIKKTGSNGFVVEELIELFSTLLQTEKNRLDIHAPFEELGVDSILIGTLAKELGEKIGDISTTIFFEYGTIDELSGYLQEHYGSSFKSNHIHVNETPQDLPNTNDLSNEIKTYLKGIVAELLQFDDLSKVDIHSPLEELGIDSIMIGAIAKKMQEKTGEIPTTVFFEYTTIEELSGYLEQNHAKSFSSSKHMDLVTNISNIEPLKNTPNSTNEVIAIIGLSGKYPGANNIEELWENLKGGKDSITEIPIERWDNTALYDELKGKIGKNYCKFGGFIDGVDQFDPLFFSISPREAERMDPQERLFLQTAWEAVEDAGYRYHDLSRRSKRFENIRSGVYVGVMYEEYQLHGAIMDPSQGKVALGGNPAGIANRVSYCMDFNGPSIAVDTMCSSSLTSVHLACNDLKSRETDVAIAGGVNLTVHPNKYLVLSQGTFLSPRGKCESFGDKGEGFVPSEGVGAVILKRLSDALRDGDRIYATIEGSTVNHGGKGNGYTIPNPAAQASVISATLTKAGITGDSIDYIEAHGTGTVLGDPIEIEGLNKAFNTTKKQFCKIGSIKSNIGHCESAAGISGLTKVILQLKNKQLVPSLHSESLNPNINFENTPFEVQQKLEDWEVTPGKLRLSGISGFGAGGSNAHLIIQEYPQRSSTIISEESAIILLSAKNKKQLKVYAQRYIDFLKKNENLNLHEIAYTLQSGRVEMDERLAVEVDNKLELIKQLELYIHSEIGSYKTGNLKDSHPLSSHELEGLANDYKTKISALWLRGVEVDSLKLYPNKLLNKISLPTYPFETNRYWFDSFLKKGKQPSEVKPQVVQNELVKTVYATSVSMTTSSDIRVEYPENGVAVVYMEARSTKNMFTYDFVNSLHGTFDKLRKNEDVKVVVLTGYENVFAMGGSKEGLLDLSNNKGAYTDIPFIYKGLLEFNLPVITAMQGHAFGGGLVFGLYGDIVVLSEKSTYCANFMNYGFTPGMGATHIMSEKLGRAITNEMLFTGRMYSGKEIAVGGGTIKVVNNVMQEALKIAREMSSKPRLALSLLKEKLANEILDEQDFHIAKEVEMQKITFGTPEVKTKIEAQFANQNHSNKSTLEIIDHEVALSLGKIKLIAPSDVSKEPWFPNLALNKKITLDSLSEKQPEINLELHPISTIDYVDVIRKIVGQTLYIDDAEITADVLFIDLGLDSINGVEILREINHAFSTNLEGAILYEYGTIESLVAHITSISKQPISVPIRSISNHHKVPFDQNNQRSVSQRLKMIIGDALHLEPEDIDTENVFTELGMDSINGVEILREINSIYATTLEGAILYDYPTVTLLAAHIQGITGQELAEKVSSELPVNSEVSNLTQPIQGAKNALKRIISESLHLSLDEIDDAIKFTELGMDSINGVEIIREVNAVFNSILEASDLYQYPSINELISVLIDEQNTVTDLVKEPLQNNQPFDLSYMQQAYWVGENKELELGGKQAHLTVQFAHDEFDPERLNHVMDQLIMRHDILRVKFLTTGQQLILDRVPSFKTSVNDLKTETQERSIEIVTDCINEKRRVGPDKLNWPLFDFTVFTTNSKDQLVVNMSLLVCDGGSVAIFFKEFFELYFHPNTQLPALEVNFHDYVKHLNEQKKSDKYQIAKTYWQSRIANLPLGPELPYQQGGGSGIMIHKERKIDRAIFALLKEKAKQNNVSLAVLLCTIYTKALANHSRSQHFLLTMMTLGREFPNPQINAVLGNFSQISILELDYRVKQSFADELKAVAKQIWEDQKFKSYNGIDVIRDLNVNRGIVGKIAVPMTFASAFGLGYDESHVFERVSASLQVPQVAMDHQVCEESDGRLLISFDIDEGFFQLGVTDDIINTYEQAITYLATADWNVPLKGLISEDQLQLIEESNQTQTSISDKFLFDPFEESAKLFPDKIAVIDADRVIKYNEIQLLSNQIANRLRNNGVVANQLIGVMMHKGWEQVPATLGIMKAGGAYLPLDPTLPESRLAYILEKAEVKELIITNEVMSESVIIPDTVNVLVFETDFSKESSDQPQSDLSITDLAYTIFTSGSTGFPKGVMIDHRGALNTCLDINKRFDLGNDTVVLALSALYFDLSVYDIFGILGCGGTIVYPDYTKLRDPGHWAKLVEKHKVTVWNSVPELMNMFMEYNTLLGNKSFEGLSLVMMSGDWIPVSLPQKIKQAIPNARVISLGGATEASIWSIFHEIETVDPNMKSIPYGKALYNQTMHVLNDQLEPCSLLTIGNIFIGGIGVAQGYLKDDEKTHNHFIVHPKTREIIYKTGDLGRVLRNGDIEFLGREDFQVKVQGYRIELGDIENAILRSEQVKAALVDVKKDVVGNNYLVAYVVPRNHNIDEKEMVSFLQGQLQGYMVPKYIINLLELPTSNNGKIDRKQLPDPHVNRAVKATKTIVSSKLQVGLESIWKELLAVQEINQQHDFFELGGNSLLAIRLAAKIQSDLTVTIDLGELLQYSIFEGQLELLGRKEESVPAETKSIVGIKNITSNGQPLFLVHPIGGSVFCYNQLAKGMNPNTPVYGFHATGNIDSDVVKMAKKYIKEMKTIQPFGPYCIGGWSFGGIIAFEMAQQLEQAGEKVEELFLIDSYFHSEGYQFENAHETEIFEKFLKDITYQKGGTPIKRSSMEQMMTEAVSNNLFPAEITLPSINKMLEVFKNNCIAFSGYKATHQVNCKTQLLIAKNSSYIGSERQMKMWDNWLLGQVKYHSIEGDHFTIFSGESLKKMIEVLNTESKLVNS